MSLLINSLSRTKNMLTISFNENAYEELLID